jgi:hypothetical protein
MMFISMILEHPDISLSTVKVYDPAGLLSSDTGLPPESVKVIKVFEGGLGMTTSPLLFPQVLFIML